MCGRIETITINAQICVYLTEAISTNRSNINLSEYNMIFVPITGKNRLEEYCC